jgi:putative tricarboxylic transport membrane protein
LFVEQKDFVWGLIASMYLGNLVGLIVVLSTVPLFASILRIPFSIIAPVIIVICAIGAYTVHSAMLDIWFMMGFGVIGYLFKKLDYPLAPLVLALVLGDKAEDSFRQAMLVSQGELTILWSNPLVGTISTLAIGLLVWPLISKLIAKVRPSKVTEFKEEQPVD